MVSSLAPVQLSRGVRDDYFVPLCSSPISRTADRYRAQNELSGARLAGDPWGRHAQDRAELADLGRPDDTSILEDHSGIPTANV